MLELEKKRPLWGVCALYLLLLSNVLVVAKPFEQPPVASHGQTGAAPKVLHLGLPLGYHMDPVLSMDAYSVPLIGNVYEGLLEYHYLERPMKLVPNLAAAMPIVSPDGCTYTVALREGVFFHDDLVVNYLRILRGMWAMCLRSSKKGVPPVSLLYL